MKLKEFFKRKSKLRKFFAFAALAINLFAGGLKTNNSKTITIGSSDKKESFEKVISNQEFNSLDGSYNSEKIYQIGRGTNLEFQQKIFQTSLMDKIELVTNNGKDSGILPGAESFPINRGFCRRSYIPYPRVPIFTGPDTELNARKYKRELLSEDININKKYREFVEEQKSKGFFIDDVDCDLQRFKELSTNHLRNMIDEKALIETKTIIQAENKNLVINARRPNLRADEPDLDFVIDGPGIYKYADVKNPIDPRDHPPATGKPPSFDQVAEGIGKKIIQQRKKARPGEVLHIIDYEKIPPGEKDNMTKKIYETVGSSKDIKFIN